MSMYNQHINHSKNHRKDKFRQQCGFRFDDKVESGAAVAQRTAESYHVRDMRSGEVLSEDFNNPDDAVDFLRRIENRWCGVYTNNGICLMK